MPSARQIFFCNNFSLCPFFIYSPFAEPQTGGSWFCIFLQCLLTFYGCTPFCVSVFCWWRWVFGNNKSNSRNNHCFCVVLCLFPCGAYTFACICFGLAFVFAGFVFTQKTPFRCTSHGVCRSSDYTFGSVSTSFNLRSIRSDALPQPSLRAITALTMTGFHRTQFPAWRQHFVITATDETRRFFIYVRRVSTCSGFSPDSLVQRTRMCV